MKTKLKELVKKNFTTYEIADELNISRQTVMVWLKKYGLKTNFVRGQVKNNIGSTGQISHLRKSCWELTRPLRITRFWLEYPEKNSCEKCGGKKFLLIHHKNGNRKQNNKENIEVLCRSCHSITHDTGKTLPKDGGWSKRRR